MRSGVRASEPTGCRRVRLRARACSHARNRARRVLCGRGFARALASVRAKLIRAPQREAYLAEDPPAHCVRQNCRPSRTSARVDPVLVWFPSSRCSARQVSNRNDVRSAKKEGFT